MNVEDFRDYCLSLAQAEENMPWTEPQYQIHIYMSKCTKVRFSTWQKHPRLQHTFGLLVKLVTPIM
ncbi:MAG: hypothetical protein HDS03_07690 [Bacteroides sp.]|nr:hypothetical protein [Bacteroides sp.]